MVIFETLAVVSMEELVWGVWTESFASWSDGETVVATDDADNGDWAKAWVIACGKLEFSTEFLFFSVDDIGLQWKKRIATVLHF